MQKKILYTSLLIIVVTYIEVLWYSPEGLSSVDLSRSPIDYLHWLCLFAVIVTGALLYVFRNKKTRPVYQAVLITLLMMAYWLMINYGEFEERVANWSTFSDAEVLYCVSMESVVPIGVCSVLLLMGFYGLRNKY